MSDNQEKNEKFIRSEKLLGDEGMRKLSRSCVAIFGLGGVGGYALEALVRSGVGSFVLVDFDRVSESNINRQILATVDTVGSLKTDVAEQRAKKINPDVVIHKISEFVDKDNIRSILEGHDIDYIVDAIDTVTSKIELVRVASELNISIVSSMGTGNKLSPELFCVIDIKKTHTCPLARVMRKKLVEKGITHLDVLFSPEKPVSVSLEEENGRHPPASVSFVPSVGGLVLGGYVVKKLTGVL